MNTAEVLVFARAPAAGRVKTRLIPALGEVGAAALHARMVRHAVETAAAAAPGRVTLCTTPDASHPLFRELAARLGCRLSVQRGADLGERMHAALGDALQRAPAALLAGSDCPALTASDLRAAASALAGGEDAVLVPALDGGYVLVGLRRPCAEMFAGVSWGTASVLEQTRARLRAAGLAWRELQARPDIDEPDDLRLLPPALRAPMVG